MRRLLIYALLLSLTAVSSVIAANQPVAEIKRSVLSLLDSVEASRATASLSMKMINTGAAGVRVGDEVSLVFASNQNCFVTIFWVESSGDINLFKAWGYEEALSANGNPGIFPAPSVGALAITPPLGRDSLYAFCTVYKPDLSIVPFDHGIAGVTAKEAVTKIPKLLRELSDSGDIIASAKMSVNIIGRENSVFSEEDIIQNFRGASRSTNPRSVLAVPVQFNIGSDRILDSALEMLNNIGSAFTSAELGQSRFRINGHTDATGSDAYNDDLSERRAKAVKSYLVTRFNIEPSRLETVGWGENMAKSDNSTDEGRAENRRVEFELLD